MLKNSSDHEASARIAPLVDLAVRHAPQLSDIQLHRGQRRLQQLLDEQRVARRRHVSVPAWAAAAALIVVVAVASWRSRTPAIQMTVEGASWDVASGQLTQDDRSRPAQLRFSDGSQIDLGSYSRVRVQELSQEGATMALESGRLRAHIAPRRTSSWDFHAGPFKVHVVGTAFDLNWEESSLSVVMRSGQVSVSGPLIGDGMPVAAGQTLHVNLLSNKVRLETPAATPAALPSQPTVSAPEARAPSSPSERPSDAQSPAASATARRLTWVQTRRTERWSSMLRAGAVSEIVADARALGIEPVMQRASSVELQALADAARYMRDNGLATRALHAQRSRFPGTKAACEAAFHLGRMTETVAEQPNRALVWYDRYLGEDTSGTYRAEALGRKMVVLERLQQTQEARLVAQQYLRHQPQGPYAKIARGLVATE